MFAGVVSDYHSGDKLENGRRESRTLRRKADRNDL